VLEYRIVPAIVNDSLSKRTMKVVNDTFKFQVLWESARWMMAFKLQGYVIKGSHKLMSRMVVFLGILDLSNGEGGSAIGGW